VNKTIGNASLNIVVVKETYFYRGCFLKHAANRNPVIYRPILINKKSNKTVKKHFKMDTFFIFLTLIVMSNKYQLSFFKWKHFFFNFYSGREFLSDF
jgi:hypothetical protein